MSIKQLGVGKLLNLSLTSIMKIILTVVSLILLASIACQRNDEVISVTDETILTGTLVPHDAVDKALKEKLSPRLDLLIRLTPEEPSYIKDDKKIGFEIRLVILSDKDIKIRRFPDFGYDWGNAYSIKDNNKKLVYERKTFGDSYNYINGESARGELFKIYSGYTFRANVIYSVSSPYAKLSPIQALKWPPGTYLWEYWRDYFPVEVDGDKLNIPTGKLWAITKITIAEHPDSPPMEKLSAQAQALQIINWYKEMHLEHGLKHLKYIDSDDDIASDNNISLYNYAIEDYEQALKFDPNYKEAWFHKGYALSKSGKYSEELESYEQALRTDPKYIDALLNKGIVLTGIKEYQKAFDVFKSLLEINPKEKEGWFNLGVVLEKLDKPEEALDAYNEALQIDIIYPEALCNKGILLNKAGKYREALELLNDALMLGDNPIELYINKGIALSKLAQLENKEIYFNEALDILNQAMSKRPFNPLVYYSRACLFSLKKNKRRALDNLTDAFKLDKELKHHAQIDEDFQWLWEDEEFKTLVK